MQDETSVAWDEVKKIRNGMKRPLLVIQRWVDEASSPEIRETDVNPKNSGWYSLTQLYFV